MALKNELNLVDLALDTPDLRPVLRESNITARELYVLAFHGRERFLEKARKGDADPEAERQRVFEEWSVGSTPLGCRWSLRDS